MNAVPEEITSLVGREVYSNNGVFVGGSRTYASIWTRRP